MKQFIIYTFLTIATLPHFKAQKLSNELIWNTREFNSKGIEGFKAMKDGNYFSKITMMNDSICITKHTFTNYNGTGEVIVNLSRFSSTFNPSSVFDYSFSGKENKILIATKYKSIYRRSYTAEYYVINLTSKKIQPIHEFYGPQKLAKFSPDGNFVSFVYENNLYVKNLEKDSIYQVTKDGTKNNIINATTDWVYEEEFGFTDAYRWAPDSKSIAFLKFNESNVKEISLPIYGELYPSNLIYKYPKAGEDNSKVSALVYQLNNKQTTELRLGDYEYIPKLLWTKKDPTLILFTLNRHQNNLRVHSLNVTDTLITEPMVFYSERTKSYLEIDENISILSNNTIILTSERDEYKHLYQLDLKGKMTQITKGKWDVIDYYGINEKNNKVYYTSSELGAIYKTIFSIDLSGKNKKIISQRKGYNDAVFSSNFKYFIKSHTDANTPAVYSLCNYNGKEIAILESNINLQGKLNSFNISPKTFFKLKGVKKDSLNAWMIKPLDFDPLKKYPVYINVYGGPGHNTVRDEYEGKTYLFHQLLAQKGYIVISIDPRGTMYRGVNFKKCTYLQLGKLELEDIIATTQEIKKINYVDSERVGIQGWSFGGFLSSLALTKSTEFKMGVAIAPVTNWKYYDNIYTERFMQTPTENKSGYEENSPINYAKDLHGKYLIVHGSLDDNVHIQNTMDMISELIKHDKQFSSFIYPNKNHSIYGQNVRNHLFNMILEFTIENL